MGRLAALALLAVGRRIAASRFHPDGQAHFLDRGDEVALHIVRQRLQRRNIQRVKTVRRGFPGQPRRREIGQRRQKPRQRLARAGICHQHRVVPPVGSLQHIGLVPPHAPVTPGEPVGNFWRDTGMHTYDSTAGTRSVPRRASGFLAPYISVSSSAPSIGFGGMTISDRSAGSTFNKSASRTRSSALRSS